MKPDLKTTHTHIHTREKKVLEPLCSLSSGLLNPIISRNQIEQATRTTSILSSPLTVAVTKIKCGNLSIHNFSVCCGLL